MDEIDAHAGVFKADAAHPRVLFVQLVEPVGYEREVVFELAEVVGLLPVAQPGELEGEVALPVMVYLKKAFLFIVW